MVRVIKSKEMFIWKHKIFFILVIALVSSLPGAAQTEVIINKSVSPSETYSEFIYDNIKTGASDVSCGGVTLSVKIIDTDKMIASVTSNKLDGGPRDATRAKININWNSCKEGVAYIQVYYESHILQWKCHWYGCFRECFATGPRYMYTYKITRKNDSPAGELIGNPFATATDAQGYTTFTLTYLPSAEYKNFPGAKTIRYRSASDATVDTEIPLEKSATSYLPTTITYRAKGFGNNFIINPVVTENCKSYSITGKTLTVMPTCYLDDRTAIQIIPQGVSAEKTFPDGYEVDLNTSYSIVVKDAVGIKDATEIQANYNLGSDAGSQDITLNNNSFIVLKDLKTFHINLTVKPDRVTWCKTPTNPLTIFTGGSDRTFADICSIELPRDFAKLGFPDIDLSDISLKHFEGFVKSQRSIVVMPGITLEDGAELSIETVPQGPNTDLKMNFTEQTTFDEYGRILSANRNYFDDNGRPLQTQYKNLSKDVILANAILYDGYGRPAISTLSAPISSGKTVLLQCADDTQQEETQLDFGYKPDFIKTSSNEVYGYSHFDLAHEFAPLAVDGAVEETLGWYYSSHNGASTNQNLNEPLVATTQYPYTRTLFKHDGSGDVKNVTKPGDAFKAGSMHLGTSDPEIIEENDSYLRDYLSIRETELNLPKPPAIAGEFTKTIITDGSGKQSIAYTDKGGKTIISLTFDEQGQRTSKSYQFYDNAGRLLVSISPNGLNQYTGSNFDLIDKTRYFYNNRGLLSATEEKDGGRSEYIYRKDGKIRFSQNAEQGKATHPERYSYTNYDKAGRPIESGEYTFVSGGIAFDSPEMKNILENTNPDGGIPETTGIKSQRTFTYYDEPNSTLRTQRFVQGAVSYSKKDNSITTWYSYDERGRVEWMIQDITGFDIKTIDYRYGPTGQVQDVIYQKGKPDQFTHFYEYDKDGRLFKAYTTRLDLEYDKTGALTNPGILELQATYFYYLHGPLKRVELANKLQGIDYVYMVDGTLKSINHADPTKDPGGDGPNGVKPDVFGMTIDYFAGDYTGANYDAGSLIAVNGSYGDQYTGLIKATRWHGPVEPGKQFGYGYKYDNRNQFKLADWGTISGAVFTHVPLDPYKESVSDYDDNGNIKFLQRNATLNRLSVDNANISIADFAYHYKPYSNQLDNITQGGQTFRSYGYDDLGQMTQETEGGKSKFVVYDVTGKVTAVYGDEAHTTKPITTFEYDDRGFRLNKTAFDENYVASLRTWYVRDASGNMISTYEEDLAHAIPPKPTEVPVYGSGKIGLYKPAYGTTFYEVTDHLGNVRAVIGDELSETYTATMESELHEKETGNGFVNLKSDGPAIYNTTPDEVVDDIPVTGDEVCKISYRPDVIDDPTNTPIGVGKMLWVHPGDKVRASVNAKYADFNGSIDPVAGLVGFLTKVFTNGTVVDGVSIFNVLNDPEAIAIAAASPLDETQPRAFLNYILFDKNFKLVDVKSVQVSDAAKVSVTNQTPERLFFDDFAIEKEGFIYFYVSNMSDQNMEVYFDDLSITHTYSNIVAGGDFYPYGLAIKDRQIDREKYRFGYQGQYAEKDDETGWNHFELREYDPVIGRWLSIDPDRQFTSPYIAFGNDPVNNTDPDGGLTDKFKGFENPIHWWQRLYNSYRGYGYLNDAYQFKSKNDSKEFLIEYHEGGAIAYALTDVQGIDEKGNQVSIRREVLYDFWGFNESIDWGAPSSSDIIPGPAALIGKAEEVGVKTVLKSFKLPTSGKIRFVPPKSWKPTIPLLRGSKGGFIDRFGNEWVKPKGLLQGSFHWDVQLGKRATPGFIKLSNSGRHVNITQTGQLAH